jgi:hypothetical protein
MSASYSDSKRNNKQLYFRSNYTKNTESSTKFYIEIFSSGKRMKNRRSVIVGYIQGVLGGIVIILEGGSMDYSE